MKKIVLTILLTLFTSVYAPKANANFTESMLSNTSEKLKMACVASKLSNPIMTIGGTLLVVPVLYLLSNYINSRLLTKKENESFIWRLGKASTKLIANLGLTLAGASVIGYQLNKFNIYPNVMKILGVGSFVEKTTCNELIWPYFKGRISGNI